MQTEGRVTRSRARTQTAGNDQTPAAMNKTQPVAAKTTGRAPRGKKMSEMQSPAPRAELFKKEEPWTQDAPAPDVSKPVDQQVAQPVDQARADVDGAQLLPASQPLAPTPDSYDSTQPQPVSPLAATPTAGNFTPGAANFTPAFSDTPALSSGRVETPLGAELIRELAVPTPSTVGLGLASGLATPYGGAGVPHQPTFAFSSAADMMATGTPSLTPAQAASQQATPTFGVPVATPQHATPTFGVSMATPQQAMDQDCAMDLAADVMDARPSVAATLMSTPVTGPVIRAFANAPKSATVNRALERARTPLTAVKTGTPSAAFRLPSSSVRPASATATTTPKQLSTPGASKATPLNGETQKASSTPAAATAPQRTTPVRPKSAAAPSPSPAKTIGITGPAKRVSISTPVHDSSDASGKVFARTPFAKSAGKDFSDADDTAVEIGSVHGDDDMQGLCAQLGMEEQEVAQQTADDALMALAAALPPSSRPTQEDVVVVSEPAAMLSPMPAATAMASSQLTPSTAAKTALAATPKASGSSTTPSTVKQLTVPTSASFMRPTAASVAKAADDKASLNELKRQYRAELLKKKAATAKSQDEAEKVVGLHEVRTTPLIAKPAPSEDVCHSDSDSDNEVSYSKATENQLTEAMSSLNVGPRTATNKVSTLRGIPAPQGTHVRFDDEGQAMPSPTSGKVVLKGVPVATGSHKRWNF